MVDVNAIIAAYLALDYELRELAGSRIYGARDVPPAGYDPSSDGACVTFRVRGGDTDYDDALHRPSVQIKCYGTTEYNAWQVYRALFDHLHNGRSANILHAEIEQQGQSLEEPDTQWPFVLTFFRILIRETGG